MHDIDLSPPLPARTIGSRSLSLLLLLANAALIAVFQGTGVILIPAAVEAITPDCKIETLALITTLSAIMTVVALILGGVISDRTRSRWGRRTPSLAAACLASVLLLPLVAAADTVWHLLLLMPLLGFTLNYYQAVLLAILPDRILEDKRGFASAAISLGVPLGIAGGVNVAAYAPSPLAGYLALGTLLLVASLLLFVLAPEPSARELPNPAEAREGSSDFSIFESFGSRDFTLAFLSRFLLFVAYFTVMGYLFYVVQDYVGLANLPDHSPSVATSRIMSFATLGWILITPLTGFIADRVHHTKLFVGLSSIGIGAAMMIPVASSDWSAMLAFGGFLGLFFGVYMAIDLKLMAMVLPSPETAGRDMGILSVASSGPIVLAPSIAAAIIALGSYRALFGSVAKIGGSQR